jgi:hypothetical protein
MLLAPRLHQGCRACEIGLHVIFEAAFGMVVRLLLLLPKGEAATGERTLLAAVMTVVVNAWNERRVLRSRDVRLQFRVHRTSALQELRWSSVDDFRPKVEGTRQIIG